MKFQTHTNPEVSMHGTSFMGTIQASRTELEKAFGAPLEFDNDAKVTTLWVLRFENGFPLHL